MVATLMATKVTVSAKGSFQSPFHRGNGCYLADWNEAALVLWPFSPLFIGAMVATGY